MRPLSVLFPLQFTSAELFVRFARDVERLGVRRLWVGQSFAIDTHPMLAFLAGTGFGLPLGIGASLLPMRDPLDAARQARSIAALSGLPLVAAFAPGEPSLVHSLTGREYSSPLAEMRSYLTAVKSAMNGSVYDLEVGRANLPAALSSMPDSAVEIGAGVLRPRMAELAGELADVAVTSMTPPDYLKQHIVSALARPARSNARPVRLVTYVHAAVRQPGRDPWKLAYRAANVHLRTRY